MTCFSVTASNRTGPCHACREPGLSPRIRSAPSDCGRSLSPFSQPKPSPTNGSCITEYPGTVTTAPDTSVTLAVNRACTHGSGVTPLIAKGQAPAAAGAAETSPPSRSRNRPRRSRAIKKRNASGGVPARSLSVRGDDMVGFTRCCVLQNCRWNRHR